MTMKPGDKVTWHHTPRGGWFGTLKIPAVVVHLTAQRVRIRVGQIVGRSTVPIERIVTENVLTRRTQTTAFESILEGRP